MLRILTPVLQVSKRQCSCTPALRPSVAIDPDSIIATNLARYLNNEKQELSVLNSRNSADKLLYDTKLSNAKTIVSFKDMNGPYNKKSQIESISRTELDKFFYSDVTARKKKTLRTTKRPLIVPGITDNLRKDAKTYVGLHLSCGIYSWAHISHDMQVLDWDFILYTSEFTSSPIFNTVHLVHTLTKVLPHSDVYVTEDMKLVRKNTVNAKNSPKYFEEFKLMSAILSSLAVQHSVESCFVMCLNLSARYFNLIVGSEIVSADGVMRTILSNYNEMNSDNDKELQVHISESLKDKFWEQTPAVKEQMSWSLLKTLTFIKLLQADNFKD